MELQTTMNIPEVSIQTAVDELLELYSAAVSANIPFSRFPTPFLWGAAGVGKSQGVRQFADDLAAKTNKTVSVTDVRLLLFNPVDLRGIPTANNDKTLAVWLKPKIFEMDGSDSHINILFLDELSAAPPAVQAAAYQICLDRRVGEHELPSNTIVIAAGNRTTDQSVSYKMPKALCNRLAHFHIVSNVEAWRAWAIANGVDARIIGYLAFDATRLCVEPSVSDYAFSTPRSWSYVDAALKALNKDPKELFLLISSYVGIDTATDFKTWCQIYRHLPSVEDVLEGRCTVFPKKADVLYALTANIVSAVCERRQTMDVQTIDNIWEYASHFPIDYAMVLFKDMNNIPEIKLLMMKSEATKRWMDKVKHG